MTGKFHTSWGDFHSYKNEAALEFECFHALALGGGCSIGDQLHPSGRLDEVTYDLIGGVYRSVLEKEPWCRDALPVSEIALVTPEAFDTQSDGEIGAHRHPTEALGAVRMLQELRLQFDVVDAERDLSRYRLVILPDVIPVDAALPIGSSRSWLPAAPYSPRPGRASRPKATASRCRRWGSR